MDMNTLEAIKYTVSAAWWLGLAWVVLAAVTRTVIGVFILDKS